MAEAQQSLALVVRTRPGYEFWPDLLSYADARLDQVRGHRQVTDVYLVSLAASRPGSWLATLDEGLVEKQPGLAVLVSGTT